MDGDADALSMIILHYRAYILSLSKVKVFDEFGNHYTYVDESIRSRLEAKLIQSIITGFDILS